MALKQIARWQFITMDEGPLGHLQQIEKALQAGIRWVQLRMKQAGDGQFLETAWAALNLCTACDATLIINDRVDIALETGAHGVHLGKADMPVGEARSMLGSSVIIGGTANTLEDILLHAGQGADYIGLGPFRFTTTKKKLSPVLGLEGYTQILGALRERRVAVPVVGIGGILPSDVPELLGAGVYGIAFSGMLVHAADPAAMVSSFGTVLLNHS